MSSVLSDLKKMRTHLGITQMDLARQAQVSLPTIQNIEADSANPSLLTLQSLAEQLGLEVKLTVKSSNWDLLAFYGAPLLSQKPIHKHSLSTEEFIQCLRQSCLELTHSSETQDRERKLEATQALLLALQFNYPSLYKKYFKSSKIIEDIIPNKISGRLIKLKRIATARLAEYL